MGTVPPMDVRRPFRYRAQKRKEKETNKQTRRRERDNYNLKRRKEPTQNLFSLYPYGAGRFHAQSVGKVRRPCVSPWASLASAGALSSPRPKEERSSTTVRYVQDTRPITKIITPRPTRSTALVLSPSPSIFILFGFLLDNPEGVDIRLVGYFKLPPRPHLHTCVINHTPGPDGSIRAGTCRTRAF